MVAQTIGASRLAEHLLGIIYCRGRELGELKGGYENPAPQPLSMNLEIICLLSPEVAHTTQSQPAVVFLFPHGLPCYTHSFGLRVARRLSALGVCGGLRATLAKLPFIRRPRVGDSSPAGPRLSSASGSLQGLGKAACFPALGLRAPVLFQFNPRGTYPSIINNTAY